MDALDPVWCLHPLKADQKSLSTVKQKPFAKEEVMTGFVIAGFTGLQFVFPLNREKNELFF